MCFHPSKEGFKGKEREKTAHNTICFHPSKEGFKVDVLPLCVAAEEVSIPLRKVSRIPEGFEYDDGKGFHPSKEGFKGSLATCTPRSSVPVSIPLRKVSRGPPAPA